MVLNSFARFGFAQRAMYQTDVSFGSDQDAKNKLSGVNSYLHLKFRTFVYKQV